MPESDSELASEAPPGSDPWSGLARFTAARIALGRTGGSLRTPSLLDFRLAHAGARDSVWREFDPAGLAKALDGLGAGMWPLRTGASDRATYLTRPDLGRRLDPAARGQLADCRWGARDLAIIVSDGLSALAAERHAPATLAELVPALRALGWSLYPIFIVPYARVKLQDEIGELLGARQTLMLVGERPGLGAPDSLGAYFTFRPRADRTDADRNCVSNIRPEGLPPAAGARKLLELLVESAKIGLSGVALKDGGQPAVADSPRQ